MKITPLEIRQKAFEKNFRGYNQDEVNAFLQTLSQEQALERMGTYLQAIKDGDNYHKLDDLCTDTIMGYARAAALYLKKRYQITVPLYIQTGGAQKQNTLNPFLSNLLSDRHT